MKTIAFFNNKGCVGKTSLVYHLAWKFADAGHSVLAVDLDPQANLTASFLSEDRLTELWPDGPHDKTIYGAIQPLKDGTGDIQTAYIEKISETLGLVVGDLALSGFEDELSAQWSKCADGDARAFRVETAFWRIIKRASAEVDASVVLINVGPNLGAINRAALIASDYVVVPLAPDLYSIQGLKNLGPTLREWRRLWTRRIEDYPNVLGGELPQGRMEAAGYVVLQYSVRLDRPTKAYDRWMAKIPEVFQDAVLDKAISNPGENEYCLAKLKHYRSLMALAHEAGKPVFHLRPSDGAIGAHIQAAIDARGHFEALGQKIAERTGVVWK